MSAAEEKYKRVIFAVLAFAIMIAYLYVVLLGFVQSPVAGGFMILGLPIIFVNAWRLLTYRAKEEPREKPLIFNKPDL